jgi:hypothetical protein
MEGQELRKIDMGMMLREGVLPTTEGQEEATLEVVERQ